MLRPTLHSFTTVLICILLSASPALLYASDLEKENRMKNQVIDFIMNGDAVLLKDNKHKFLSIFMESEIQPARGVIIVMHGRGHHPNWPEVVFPLRTGLTEYGWHTFSIQLPVLDNESSFYDYLEILHEAHPRINAAIQYLKDNNYQNIILLAHSCSVHMAIDWLHKSRNTDVSAFIGIGMGPVDIGQPMPEPFPLEKIKIPILDIHADQDYPAVILNAPRRLKNMHKAGNPKSQQSVVANADHYFTRGSETLLVEITNWLEKL